MCDNRLDATYLAIIKSQIPLSVNFLCGDCSIAIVMSAMYE